jgi:mannosyltransferase
MDYDQVADIIDRYAAYDDCLVVDDSPDPKRRWWPLRRLLVFRPDVYEKLIDPGRITAVQTGLLFDTTAPISDWAKKLADCQVLWTISSRDATLPKHQLGSTLPPDPQLEQTETFQVPSQLGFYILERWQFKTTQVSKSTR